MQDSHLRAVDIRVSKICPYALQASFTNVLALSRRESAAQKWQEMVKDQEENGESAAHDICTS